MPSELDDVLKDDVLREIQREAAANLRDLTEEMAKEGLFTDIKQVLQETQDAAGFGGPL